MILGSILLMVDVKKGGDDWFKIFKCENDSQRLMNQTTKTEYVLRANSFLRRLRQIYMRIKSIYPFLKWRLKHHLKNN